ncbi:uncharacterized protein LOC134138865 [Rhea pennata]|uniref:uncharacterized protein LOC134138864 n=1 Tax=Rhea pennata TaxID=8795 RepID=UPI002E26E798
MGQANCCGGKGATSPAPGTQRESAVPRARHGLFSRRASRSPQPPNTFVSRRSPELLLRDRVWVTRRRRTTQRHLLLFPDAVAVASLKFRSTFCLRHRVCLSQLWVVSGEDEAASEREERVLDEDEDEDEEVFSLSRQNTLILIWPSDLCAVTFWSREGKERWLQAMLSRGSQGPRVTRLPSLRVLMEAISFSRPGVTAETARKLILADAEAKQYSIQAPAASEEGLGHSAELHSEDHCDEAVECQVECQKSHHLHTPPSPLTTEAPIGGHVAAQAGQREPQVSDFDLRVEPLLQALLHVTVEQASLEIVVEEELAFRWAQQCTYLRQYNAEMAERLEEQQRRHREEEERGRHQYMQGQQQEEEATQKTAAPAFAQYYLADPTPSLLTSLPESGDFCEQPETDIEKEFLPWWTAEAEEAQETRLPGKAVLASKLSQEKHACLLSCGPVPDEHLGASISQASEAATQIPKEYSEIYLVEKPKNRDEYLSTSVGLGEATFGTHGKSSFQQNENSTEGEKEKNNSPCAASGLASPLGLAGTTAAGG